MGVEDLFIWYQKKIGTYDKQKWETTIEQRILYGLRNIEMKNTKPNTDFIDLDLVRGSSFLKVKPKQGFMAIAQSATLRCIFLPIYSKWWIKQTSIKIYLLLLLIYITHLINTAIYYKNSTYGTPTMNNNNNDITENIICMELIVPCLMMWVLSLIHSQISATQTIGHDCNNKTKLTTKTRHYRRKINFIRKLPTTNNESSADSITNLRLINNNRKVINNNNNNNTNKDDDDNDDKNNFIRNRKITFNDNSVDNRQRNKCANDKSDLNSDSNNEKIDAPDIVQYLISHKRCDDWLNKVEKIKTNNIARSNSDSRISSESEEESETELQVIKEKISNKKRKCHIPSINITSTVDSACDSDDEFISYPLEKNNEDNEIGELTTSATEWLGVTTNSEDEVSDSHNCDYMNDTNDLQTVNPPITKVSCIIWKKNEVKKAELSMLDISSAIIGKVESTSHSMDYFYFGIIISTILSLIPALFRLCNFTLELNSFAADGQYSIFELFNKIIEKLPNSLIDLIEAAFGSTLWERIIIITACLQRWILACLFFFLLSIAEHTFKQRFLYAKLFSHLTSFHRAQQYEVPHFRLNKVRNIKTWLSVRSYLKQRGPQRSVDVIVSTAFIITLFLLGFLCVEILKERGALNSQYHVEALIWCLGLGILLLRFITLGTKINKKYSNLSVLITEQINLYLQIEQKPHKKEELTVANNVLKLAIDLIKEIQSPFKISGLSANSFLYNITKLIILSALSGVFSEILGFKLKLHKIKIK